MKASLQATGTGSHTKTSEASVCRADLVVSCCPWRAAAGALSSVLLALQSLPLCGSALWFSAPGLLSWTPSCATNTQIL